MISKRLLLLLSLLVALALTSLPSLASAQGRGNGGRADVENRRERDRNDDRDDDRYDDRYDDDRDSRRGEGPPFCRNGEGHPVHGWEWCEEKGYGDGYGNRSLGAIIFGDDRNDRNVSGSRNYDRAHEQFHYELDRRYSDLSSRRPLDLGYQLRIRREKAAEHDRWHQQAGIRH